MSSWYVTHRRMRSVAVAVGIGGGAAVLAAMVFVYVPTADAHGSLESPISRVYACRLEGPESPTSEACRAAVAAGGTQPLYDWNEVNIPNADGRHTELIPDGQLCSAGRDKYAAFDAPRTDWPATSLPSGGTYPFRFHGTAPHVGAIDLYVTRDGYSPASPLGWSDLELTPFFTLTHDSGYEADVPLPSGKTGRHLIYAIWQRTDSPEAFYACADVVFGGGDVGAAPAPPAAPEPEPEDTEQPAPPPCQPSSRPTPATAPGNPAGRTRPARR